MNNADKTRAKKSTDTPPGRGRATAAKGALSYKRLPLLKDAPKDAQSAYFYFRYGRTFDNIRVNTVFAHMKAGRLNGFHMHQYMIDAFRENDAELFRNIADRMDAMNESRHHPDAYRIRCFRAAMCKAYMWLFADTEGMKTFMEKAHLVLQKGSPASFPTDPFAQYRIKYSDFVKCLKDASCPIFDEDEKAACNWLFTPKASHRDIEDRAEHANREIKQMIVAMGWGFDRTRGRPKTKAAREKNKRVNLCFRTPKRKTG